MKNLLFLLFLLFLTTPAFCVGQSADSLFIQALSHGRWAAVYRVQHERSIFEVAKKFSMPIAQLADENNLSYTDKLMSGTTITVPLLVANWYNHKPSVSSEVVPLYYRATRSWNATDLTKRLGISKQQLEEWNGAVDSVEPRRVLLVGWISVNGVARTDTGLVVVGDPVQSLSSTSAQWPDTVIAADTTKPIPILSPMEQAFLDQTAGGTMMTTEKGPAAFFPAGGGTVKGVHYAFHNTAPRGSVVRVHNIGTGRTAYVKVLGPMPRTKQYAGAIIGISAAAKTQLGVRGDTRAWCEVSYAGY